MASIRIATANSADRRKGRKSVTIEALWAEKGLAVHLSQPGKGWTITHLASGYAVKQHLSSSRNAITVAKRLLDAGDWTRSLGALRTDSRLKDRSFDILAQARLLGLLKVAA